jgi:hypothetical protein
MHGIEADASSERPAQDRPNVTRMVDARCRQWRLFGGSFFPESGDYLLFLNSRCRVAALTEILLFGAIAHHAGMGNLCWLLGGFRSWDFSGHAKCSVRGTLACNPANLALPQR